MNSLVEKLRTVVYYYMPCLFFIGNLKFIKMLLSYMGITTHLTIVSTIIIVAADMMLIGYFLYFIFSNNRWLLLATVTVINIIFCAPYVVNGMLYEFIQYLVFMMPFTIAATLLVNEEMAISRFFDNLTKISSLAAILSVGYILILFVGHTNQYGLVEIREMSYGDIAYATLPFFINDLGLFIREKKSRITICVRVCLFVCVLVYSGTRSALLCLIVACILQVLQNYQCILQMSFRRIASSMGLLLITMAMCLTFIPPGARLNVVKENMLYELNEERYFTCAAYNIETGKEEQLPDVFLFYVVKEDRQKSVTEMMLHNDIANNYEKFLVVSSEDKANACQYLLPMNSRLYLWSTAWKEFLKAPLFGQGALFYQWKYEGTFPHNIVLEILVDYGLVGLVFMLILVLKFFFMSVRNLQDQWVEILMLIIMYIPMHLLYHSAYFNGILYFSLVVLLFMGNKAYHISHSDK